ncbi:uncharacterized protein [Triticum aestivum]|uniref:uncharacterized protein n=1 Tax=Triticum aestivum TaxID=4565 RepID=UPI001D030BCF|nr:uncharacterized protein LOC123068796 [Triticum aestivum]
MPAGEAHAGGRRRRGPCSRARAQVLGALERRERAVAQRTAVCAQGWSRWRGGAAWRRLAAAASGRAAGAQIWAARARTGPRQPLCPCSPFSLLPPLPAAASGRCWVGEHARGNSDGCCDAVPRRILVAEAAGWRSGGAVQVTAVACWTRSRRWPACWRCAGRCPLLRLSTFLGFPPPCVSVFSGVLCHVQSESASEVLAHGSGRNPRAAIACAVNGDARGRRHLLGGVGMTLTGPPPRAPGEIVGPASRTGQRRRLYAVTLLMALLWLHAEFDAADGGW